MAVRKIDKEKPAPLKTTSRRNSESPVAAVGTVQDGFSVVIPSKSGDSPDGSVASPDSVDSCVGKDGSSSPEHSISDDGSVSPVVPPGESRSSSVESTFYDYCSASPARSVDKEHSPSGESSISQDHSPSPALSQNDDRSLSPENQEAASENDYDGHSIDSITQDNDSDEEEHPDPKVCTVAQLPDFATDHGARFHRKDRRAEMVQIVTQWMADHPREGS
ncbi:hypothetical protein BZA05DRAFT_448566 [Tricharina praecox]|uniref:uncharacterized protein n=1 Tax=Tricharina praecox TaxID=43433 RepID=UPI0022202CCE|nr:uncharacterized protein BZA05DRAFT_448566 [Tricharina praecox]KAI5844213.1 hypothetical protein BZA05DRAFT_448566 [Tricharina praecox]